MEKKVLFTAIAVFCLLIIGVGVFCGIFFYEDNQIEYIVNDTLPDGQGKKATIILLAGQSNASGCSRDDCLKENISSEKYAEYEAGYDNVYINYFATGTNQSNGFVKCSVKQGEAGGFFGPELGMAEKLNEHFPNETFFIVKYAWGGSNLHKQWLSPSSRGMTGELYRHFVKYVETSIEYLTSKNYDVKIEGLCWMQGESDAILVEHAESYETHLNNFISDVRKQFAPYSADDGIAFIDAYIADNPEFWIYCDLVNEAKLNIAESSPINCVIDTSDLVTTNEPADNPDIAHYDSLSGIALGNRFAEDLSKFFD